MTLVLHPRVTPGAVALVARFEGLRLRAAPLPQGGFVIGHGHVSADDPGRAVTADEARALLLYDLSRLAGAIDPLLLAPVGERAFEALLSFAFAIGVDAFAGSLVLRRLNAGAYLDAADAIELWRCAEVEGEPWVVDALVRRRAAEKAHFLQPPGGFAPAPSAQLRPAADAALLALAAALSAGVGEGEGRTALVDLHDGGGATLRRPPGREGEPAPTAALAVVAALSARLDRLFAEPEPPPPPPVEEVASSPSPVAAKAPEPEPPPPLPAANDHRREFASELGSEHEPASPEPAGPPAPEPRPLRNAPAAALPAAPAFRPERPPPPRVSPPSLRGPALVLGLFGLALFALSVLKTYQAPSLVWLALGLLAVLAMVPASLLLIGPRRRDDD